MGVHVTGVCSTPNVAFVKECGASDVVDYRGGDAIEQLKALVRQHGMFDMVFDTVSSADSRDRSAAYEAKIRSCADPPLVKTRSNVADAAERAGVDPHNYVVFGGTFWQFLCAAVQRFTCKLVNLHAQGFALFWIIFADFRRW